MVRTLFFRLFRNGLVFCILLSFPWGINKAQSPDSLNRKSINNADTTGISDMLRRAGELRYQDARRTLELCTEIITRCKAGGNLRKEASALNLRGQVLASLNRSQESLLAFKQALEIYESLADSSGMAVMHHNIGNYFLNESDFQNALNHFEFARGFYERLHEYSKTATTLTNIGIIHKLRGDYIKSLEMNLMALSLTDGQDNPEHYAHILRNTGNVYLDLNDYDKAMEYYFRAHEIDLKQGNQRVIAINLVNISLCYKAKHEVAKALGNFFEALTILEKTGISRDIATVLNNIASLCINQINDKTFAGLREKGVFSKHAGDMDNRLTFGKQYLDKAMQVQSGRTETFEYATSLYLLAEFYEKTGYPEQSIDYGKQALSLAERINALNIKKLALLTLANSSEQLQQPEQAISYYKEYYVFKDSIDNSTKRIELVRMELHHEYEKKEKEIIHQKEISEFMTRQATDELQKQTLLAKSREQDLLLRERELEISNKEKILHQMAYLKNKAELHAVNLEFKSKAEKLNLAEKEMSLQKLSLDRRAMQRNILILGTMLCLLSIFFIYRNYVNQRKSNNRLKILNEEILSINTELSGKNRKLFHTLDNLQQTQQQLIETEKNKERETTRRNISLDIHDDISSGLTRIAWLSEQARERIAFSELPEADHVLEKIIDSSRDTIDRLGEIIWAINPEQDDMESFYSYLRTYASNFTDELPITLITDFPDESNDIRFNPYLKRTLFLVVKEAIHNVMKHAAASAVRLKVVTGDDRYTILVEDNGKGFDPGLISDQTHGIANMKTRMESVGGSFELQSKPGEGTSIRLKGGIFT